MNGFDNHSETGWVYRPFPGSLTMGERLNQKVKQILQEHIPEPLADDKVQAIRQIAERAEQRSAEIGS